MSLQLRIGVLGAARIVRQALVRPADTVPEAAVTAIAARDPARARQAARQLGIPRVHDSYEALLADETIDAVYVALPNALHATWSIRAMYAGKHVLCEKPISSNAEEAERVASVAAATGRIVCEAMHPYYHALLQRVDALLATGRLGRIRHVESHVAFPIPRTSDIRWQYRLGGGALMDVGVYAAALLRRLTGEEPVEVTGATVKTRLPDVDRRVDARLRFPSGASGRLVAGMWGWPVIAGSAAVSGSSGRLAISNAVGPHAFNRIRLTAGGFRLRESVPRRPDTYTGQLGAFTAAILHQAPPSTGPEYFVANMRVIDAIYRCAGLPVRPSPYLDQLKNEPTP